MAVHYRRFQPEDFAALVKLINTAAERDDTGLFTSEAEQLELSRLPGRNFSQDRMLAIIDGRIIGYSDLWQSPGTVAADAFVLVHPSWRKRGIGKELHQHLLEREKVLNSSALIAYAKAPAAKAFLEQQGYQAAGAYYKFGLETLSSLPALQTPEGFILRSYLELGDVKILEQATRAQVDLFGHKVPTPESLTLLLRMFSLDGIFILFTKAEQVAGYCKVARLESGMGYLDAPGLFPEFRKAELYRTLALVGLHKLRREGCTEVMLESWGDEALALDVYRSLGFEEVGFSQGYRLELQKAPLK